MEFQLPGPFRMGINWKSNRAQLATVIKQREQASFTLGPGVSILVALLEFSEELSTVDAWALPRMSGGQPQALVIFQSFLDCYQCGSWIENCWPVAVRHTALLSPDLQILQY